jgi:predicted small secreted protein
MRTLDRGTLITLAAVSALAAAACDTVAGAGRDIANAGQAVTEAAEKAEQELKDPQG